MGSFYGNRYLEFKKFFYRFIFKNSGKNVSQFTNLQNQENENVSIEPFDSHDNITFDTANKWICIKQQVTEDGNGVALFHAPSDIGEIKTISAGIVNNDSQKETTTLKYGDKICASKLVFDAAGHISQAESMVYEIPDMSEVILTDAEMNELCKLLGI